MHVLYTSQNKKKLHTGHFSHILHLNIIKSEINFKLKVKINKSLYMVFNAQQLEYKHNHRQCSYHPLLYFISFTFNLTYFMIYHNSHNYITSRKYTILSIMWNNMIFSSQDTLTNLMTVTHGRGMACCIPECIRINPEILGRGMAVYYCMPSQDVPGIVHQQLWSNMEQTFIRGNFI